MPQGENYFQKRRCGKWPLYSGYWCCGNLLSNKHLMEKPDIILKKNAIFGEMGVIDTAPRMATAKAIDESIVLFVSKAEFEERLGQSDTIVRGVLAILSERLRDIQIKQIKR